MERGSGGGDFRARRSLDCTCRKELPWTSGGRFTACPGVRGDCGQKMRGLDGAGKSVTRRARCATRHYHGASTSRLQERISMRQHLFERLEPRRLLTGSFESSLVGGGTGDSTAA